MEKITAAVVLAIGAGYLLLARLIPDRVFFDPVGPRIFPTLVALGIIACGAAMLWPVIARAAGGAARDRAEGEEDPARIDLKQLAAVLALASLILAYALLLEPVGYVITTAGFLIIVSSYFNQGRHLQNVLVSVLLTVAVYYSFNEFLRIGLPRGLLAPLY